MFRLLVVLAISFAASQFPAFYLDYVVQVDRDLAAAQQSNASAYVIATLKDQRSALIAADDFERPLALLDAWDSDRVLSVLNRVDPKFPESEEALVHGGIGLVIGYLLTGILFAPFRRRSLAPRPPRAARTAKATRPRKARSSIPVSAGNLREVTALAKAAMREAQKMARQPESSGDDERDRASDDAEKPVSSTLGLRGNDAITFARRRPQGAITMSYDRPPLITRRHEMNYPGPIERVTIFRD